MYFFPTVKCLYGLNSSLLVLAMSLLMCSHNYLMLVGKNTACATSIMWLLVSMGVLMHGLNSD